MAFANRADRYHDWAVRVAGQVVDPLLTCEAVLAEAAFHLQDAAAELCLIRMSELHPRQDFRVYRRNKREAIPLTCWPVREAMVLTQR